MSMFNGQTVLVTGGTGSFGEYFIKNLLQKYKPKKVIIFSRDEFKQHQLKKDPSLGENCRFFIGDVRDLSRLKQAFADVDIVIHAAALKQVTAIEYNPFEAIKTNIIGSQNVVEAAISQKVKKVILISTDKAVHPANLYGATKLCAEKLFIASNSYSPNRTIFVAVRYGNVIGSRGSIVELLSNKKIKPIITDINMTRFWIDLKRAFNLVEFAIKNMQGGEIFIPKIPSMKIVDLFDILRPNEKKEIIGIKPGEKLHEELISIEESKHTIELKNYYVILPEFHPWNSTHFYDKYIKVGRKTKTDFIYNSNTNSEWLTEEQLKKVTSQETV